MIVLRRSLKYRMYVWCFLLGYNGQYQSLHIYRIGGWLSVVTGMNMSTQMFEGLMSSDEQDLHTVLTDIRRSNNFSTRLHKWRLDISRIAITRKFVSVCQRTGTAFRYRIWSSSCLNTMIGPNWVSSASSLPFKYHKTQESSLCIFKWVVICMLPSWQLTGLCSVIVLFPSPS